MLHEVLLALSGHPSPLFNSTKLDSGKLQVNQDFPLLSPSETALLQSIGRLAERHRQLKHHVQIIASGHASIICRAVATSMKHTHLARFQRKIVDVEAKILSKDSSTVGAYDIVPLAAVVGEFDDWHRLMLWLWEAACFMQPPSPRPAGTPKQGCSGAGIIDKLRAESHTGYPEIAQAATELSKIAETAWLRQLSSWLIYGKLPPYAGQDFFIFSQTNEAKGTTFNKDKTLLPAFVTWSTASSIQFIGKSLHQIKQHVSQAPSVISPLTDPKIAAKHLEYLSALPLPINQAQLARTISTIRLSLSQNVLQHLLPLETTMQLLGCLRQFFLLSRGEFGVAVITEAENRLEAREKSMGKLVQQDPVKTMKEFTITDAELQQTLAQAWKAMLHQDEDEDDALLEFARSHISLSAFKASRSRPSSADGISDLLELSTVPFNDLLFPVTTAFGLAISPPLDLFITDREMDIYATINAYILAIRRAQLRISSLWRQSSSRRNQDPDKAGARQNTKRRRELRKVWATCSAANFLVSEISAYLEGVIIKGACDHFEAWIKTPAVSDSIGDIDGETTSKTAQRDPETLASGHRSFLTSLAYALLLTDKPYTSELRSLLGNIDAFIAFFKRLGDIQRKADLEQESEGEVSDYTAETEKTIALELDRARKKVDSDSKSVVNRLKQLDHERIGAARYWNVSPLESGDFEAWKGAGGLDRLLMKLEFGRMLDGSGQISH